MRSQPFAAWIITLSVLLIAGCSPATATEISTGEEEAAECKEMIFTHSFVSSRSFESNIVAICPDGTYPRQVTTDGLYNGMPYWSPDGSQITFLSDRSGTQQLHIMDRDGGNVRQLTSGSGLDAGGVVWMPDGNRIAIALREGSLLHWQTVDVVTGEIAPMDEWTFQNAMSLSHDGTRLAYLVLTKPVQADSPIEIYIQDIDGSNTYALTSDNWIIQNPIWSPDDNQIAFLSNSGDATDQYAIYTINLDGSNLQRLIKTDLDPWMIAWSPDGESLAIYADDELYNGVLYELIIKSGEITALFKIEYPNHISHLSW